MPLPRASAIVASTAAALLSAACVFAQYKPPTTAPAPQGVDLIDDRPAGGFALTIYSTADPATFDPQQLAQQRLQNPYNAWQMKLPGYGVVREIRKIDLKEGENTIRFTDVASGIDPTTVAFESLTAPNATAVLEQNYEYDVVSATKLLEKYLGKAVMISRKASADPTDPRRTRRAFSSRRTRQASSSRGRTAKPRSSREAR